MIRLRPAEPQDEWAFWELRREIQPDLSREDHLKWWRSFEHRFMAYDGPAFVGVIRISPLDPIDHPMDHGLVHLQVAKKEQGKGLGTQMLRTLCCVAKEQGLTRLTARVEPTNEPSQRAFRSAGYTPTHFEVTL